MIGYLSEFLGRTLRHTAFLTGFALDALAFVILGVANLSQLRIAWPYLLLWLALALVAASFFVFQEERRKNEPWLEIELLRPHRDASPIFNVAGGVLHWWVPLRIRVVNRDPVRDARIVINSLVWEQKRLFQHTKHWRDIPLVKVDGEDRSEIEVAVPHADRSMELELLFEDSWADRPEAVPGRSRVMLRPQAIGSPNVEVEITTLRNGSPPASQ
jgi:hypothetical protein